MLNIVILDPGLRELGGHHPAMVNAIAQSSSVIKGSMRLEVYCHQQCSNDFISSTQSEAVSIKRHFKTAFYQYFYKTVTLFELNDYINHLTHEYFQVFEKYANNEGGCDAKKESTFFLYHTLSSEHAIALASAITLYQKKHKKLLQHYVFLMFNPQKYHNNGGLNIQHFLSYKVAFSLLSKQPNLKLYAADYELQQTYQSLLSKKNKPSSIPIHPCALLTNRAELKNKNQSIILFSGDAKVDKGFLALPEILKKVQRECSELEVSFIIQYTITNDAPHLKSIDSQLKRAAKQDKRILLRPRYWSHTEMHNNFAQANTIIFNYDAKTYANQSSGVLWMAAYYKVNIIFLTSNWLEREANRLDCNYCVCSITNFLQKLSLYLMQKGRVLDKVMLNSYRHQLFTDIGCWLESQNYLDKK